MELWRRSEKDLFGLLIVVVMVMGAGTTVYLLYWFKIDSNLPKSKTRMNKVEDIINKWKKKMDNEGRCKSSPIMNGGDLSTTHYSFPRPDVS